MNARPIRAVVDKERAAQSTDSDGNIVIRPKAHGSDASLRDDALLLSKRAHIDSIPALEIAANDVKAFHGATVGSLDEEALFYAGSRGIARSQALRLITLGFFEPVVARFPSEALRDEVRTALDRKIDDATEIDGRWTIPGQPFSGKFLMVRAGREA